MQNGAMAYNVHDTLADRAVSNDDLGRALPPVAAHALAERKCGRRDAAAAVG